MHAFPESVPPRGEAEECWSADGGRLLIRPIEPSDAGPLEAFFHRLTPEEVRLRFFAPIRSLRPEQLRAFTELDHERAMAMVAVREADRAIVGVARLIRERDDREAEFAVVVEGAMQGRGLAVRLLGRLFAWAERHGVQEVVGSILAENAAMLELAHFLGFRLIRNPDDARVVDARLRLTHASSEGDRAALAA